MSPYLRYMRYFLSLSILMVILGHSLHAQYTYKSDGNLRGSLKKQVWQKLKPETPKENRLAMSIYFAGNGLFNSYQGAAKKYGYASESLVTALAFMEVICQEVLQERLMSGAEIKSIYQQQKSQIQGQNRYQGLTGSQLQELADPIILNTMWLYHLNQMRPKDRSTLNSRAEKILSTFSIASKQKAPEEQQSSASLSNKQPKASKASAAQENLSAKTNALSININSVIMRTVTSYGLGGVYVANKVYVLFDNGELLSEPVQPLESKYLTASKRDKPNKWHRWQKQNNVILYTNSKSGKTYDWEKWFTLRKVKKGHTFNGGFQTLDPFGGAAVTNASTVYFNDQGEFAWSSVKGGYNDWRSVYVKSKHKGKYLIEGYSIRLEYAGGETERYFFGLYPKSNEHFIIGSSHFVPLEN